MRALFLAGPLILAACGSDISSSEVATIETADFAQSLGVNLASSTKTSSGLYFRDPVVGTGAVVASGQQVSVRYTGWLANGSQFDSNASSGGPFVFRAGAGQVIAGWDQGVPGMRIGGQRQLVIPPALGYGSMANGPIPGNSILVFMVTVVSAQ